MTPKMTDVANDLGNWILQNYNKDYLDDVLIGGIALDDVIFQILVECCRYAYLSNSEKHPWKYYIEQEGLELELARKNLKRTLDYVDDKFDLLQEAARGSSEMEILRPKHDLQKIKGRYPSYEITAFQYWELNNIHDMGLVKAIVERRLPYSKKVSSDKFIYFSDDYDATIEYYQEKSKDSPEDMVFSSLVLFTLQTKYSFDYYYKLACEMERQGITEMPDMHDRIVATASTFKGDSLLFELDPQLVSEGDCRIEYPMIIQRERMIPYLVSAPKSFIIDAALEILIEANILANSVQSHIRFGDHQDIRTWFKENTDLDDWASVFETYDVFRTYAPDKEWTEARIRAVRDFYKANSIDYKGLRP